MESLSPYKKEIALGILKQIEQAILRLQERTANIHSVDDFLLTPAGMEKLDASCMLLIAIGESLKGFDKVTEKSVLPAYPQIPWKNVMGVRDIIAHHYFDVDAEEIFDIVHNGLSSLLVAVRYFIQKLSNSVMVVGTNEVYKDKLNAVEWKRKCDEIKKRDNYQCVNCQNQVLIELDGVDDLKRYLGKIELENFEMIKSVFQRKEDIINSEKYLIERCELLSFRFIEKHNLYHYEMEYAPDVWARREKRILISTQRIESLGGVVNRCFFIETPVSYGGKDYEPKKDDKGITLQYNELGDTDNRYILHHCFAWNSMYYYPGAYLGQGILTYNQYSVIFPLFSLDFEKSLDVHHKIYRKKNGQFVEPWEYENSDLETLCHGCHLQKHRFPIGIIEE